MLEIAALSTQIPQQHGQMDEMKVVDAHPGCHPPKISAEVITSRSLLRNPVRGAYRLKVLTIVSENTASICAGQQRKARHDVSVPDKAVDVRCELVGQCTRNYEGTNDYRAEIVNLKISGKWLVLYPLW
jgi:hypothetical protein